MGHSCSIILRNRYARYRERIRFCVLGEHKQAIRRRSVKAISGSANFIGKTEALPIRSHRAGKRDVCIGALGRFNRVDVAIQLDHALLDVQATASIAADVGDERTSFTGAG